MKFEQLIYEEKDKTAWITLNRPTKMNALSMALSDEIVAAVDGVQDSKKPKFLVFKGAGNNFCVGDTFDLLQDFDTLGTLLENLSEEETNLPSTKNFIFNVIL